MEKKDKGLFIALLIVGVLLIISLMQQNSFLDLNPAGNQMPTMNDGPMMHVPLENYLPGNDASSRNFQTVKSSTIVDLENQSSYTMTAEIITKNINGNELTMYGYNGMIPGPALRVKQGSTVYITFENNIDMNTTVHWHGLRHDIEDDGVPGISQPEVMPGDTYDYELYFPDDGIYWYHPHVREDIQQEAGLSGNMLVIPSDPYNSVNREELLVLDDLLLDQNGNFVPFGNEHANFAIMGRYGNVMITNGKTDYSLTVQKGEVVRFYITNVANVRPFNFSISGAEMKLVGGDLGQFEEETFVDSITIAPAMRYFIDVYFEESGTYNLMNINPHEEYVLGSVTVTDEEVVNSYEDNFRNELINPRVIEDIQKYEPYFDKEVDYDLELTIDMDGMMEMMELMPCHVMGGVVMGDCTSEERGELEGEAGHEEMTIEWEDEMNMRAPGELIEWIIKDTQTKNQNMDIEMNAKVGDVIKIRLFNDPESLHPMQHPIHLHGQRVIVTHVDGEPVENKVWTDTILVPIGSTADILVDVTNPGEWMMHCHIAEHLEAGMMTTFNVSHDNK